MRSSFHTSLAPAGKAAGETQHIRNTAGVVTFGRNAAWTVQARHTIACRTARSSALSVLLWSTKAGEVGQPHRRKRKHLRSDSLRESVVPRTARSQSAPRPIGTAVCERRCTADCALKAVAQSRVRVKMRRCACAVQCSTRSSVVSRQGRVGAWPRQEHGVAHQLPRRQSKCSEIRPVGSMRSQRTDR